MQQMKRILSILLLVTINTTYAAGPSATIYKNPSCGCCIYHGKYLEDNGYDVKMVDTEDLDKLKLQFGISSEYRGCHTTVIDGYYFEGHIPVESINRFLDERPDAKGLSLPGMPTGSPGMSGVKRKPFEILLLPKDELNTEAPKVYDIQ